ncbi:glycosyltransferase [Oceanobacillus kimchii]|uniref:glycosyltransferase n=1 Tax=Oceanobacillus kimchii TaxID=746691 RepID=UPI003B0275C7
MIRVLHYGLGSKLGGIETYLYKLYKNIDRENFQFDFLTNKGEKSCFYDEFIDMGSNFYSITSRNKNLIRNRSELKNLLLKEKFDIIHCHMNSLSYSTPILMGLKTNSKVIVHSRNASTPKSLKTRFLHNYNSIILPKNKVKMLSVSDYAGDWMFGSKANYTVINNGVDTTKFMFNMDNRKKIRKELNLENQFCIIHVGAFRTQKNHIFLLEIFKYLKKYKSNSKLLLVGDGKLRVDIEREIENMGIKENVVILGNRSDISDLLAGGDAFLFPSHYEGFPNAVLEAQTSGLPCLISDTITKEVLINDNCYEFSLKSSAKEWAEKLLSIKKNDDRYDGAERILDKGFSVNSEINKIEDIYKNLIR